MGDSNDQKMIRHAKRLLGLSHSNVVGCSLSAPTNGQKRTINIEFEIDDQTADHFYNFLIFLEINKAGDL